jgi:ABC-type transport system involved in multi-copper enzyme maturation permease subunit
MMHVIFAEMRKLRRPTLLLSTMAIVTLLTTLFTFITFWRVGNPNGNGRRGEMVTAQFLSTPHGLVYGFNLVAFLLGIVALCIFASQTAQEYTYGTLRNLLVRQPARMKILGGKYISMVLFAVIMVLFSMISSIAMAYSLAGHAHVSTHSWATSAGFTALATSLGNVLLSVSCFGTVGMILGLLFRSPISAIATGVIWFLILENILAGLITSTAKWLPGQNITNLTTGQNFTFSYQHSLILDAIYLIGAGAVVSILFKRRDVAN